MKLAECNHTDVLRLRLQFLRAQQSGDPYGFQFEPQDYILPTAGGDSPSARFDWNPELLSDLQAVRLPGRDSAVVQRMGERLRRFVQDAGWTQHEHDIAQALAARRAVFLTIRSAAAELYALPWELLTFKSGQFIGERDGLLIRFEWPETKSAAELPQPRLEGGRILVAWSAAGGAVPAAEHIAAITAACTAGFHPFAATGCDVIAQASLERIVRRLEAAQQAAQPIAILHLLCHGTCEGDTFGLCLDGDHAAVVVDPIQLRQQLAPFAAMVRLVVLSACDSGNSGALGNQLGSLAQTLHRCGFQAVLASRFPLSVAGSIALTESLYGELLAGPTSLETAVLAVRKQLLRRETKLPREQRPLDWASLQLYARHDDGDDTRPVVCRPYRGLLAFQPEHRRFFFGRDAEISKVLAGLQFLIDGNKERFLVVAGASGTGKSSLVLAGAVPRLLESDSRLVLLRMRPGRDPERALDDVLANRSADVPALLVVDQFEEVFTQTESPAARSAFMQRLWSLVVPPQSGLRVIITLRVDFIGRCGELQVNESGLRLDRIAYDEAYRVFVAQLQPEQLRSAIEAPAHKVGLELQAGLADRMLQDVGHEPGALPLLEDALDVLWQHREGRTLTQTAYDALGGVIGALRRRADALVAKLDPQELAIAQRLLVNLVAVAEDTALDTRLRVTLAELRRSFGVTELDGFERVLKTMVAARLLVQDGDEQAARVEVAHEALIRKWPQLRVWLDEDRAGLLVQRRVKQAALQWESAQRDESLLYRGAQLAQASEWRKAWESRLGELERGFLDASEALRIRMARHEAERLQEERKRARQTRFVAAVLGVLLVVAAAAAVQAYRQSIEAHEGLLVAVAQSLKDDPTAAAAVLRESSHRNSRLWIRAANEVLQTRMPETILRGLEGPVRTIVFSGDGKKFMIGFPVGTTRVYDADGSGQPVIRRHYEGAIVALAFSPDRKKILMSCFDKSVRIFNIDGSGEQTILKDLKSSANVVAFSPDGRQIILIFGKSVRIFSADGSAELTALKDFQNNVSAFAVSPDGKKFVISFNDKTASVYNADGSGEPLLLKGHDSVVDSVAFNLDGTKIVTGSYDHTARVFNADGTGEPVVLKGHEDAVHSAAFSPDGKKVVTISLDKTARIFNVDGSGQPVILQGHNDAVLSVAYSPDGKKIVTGSSDATVRIFNADGFGVAGVLKGMDGRAIAFSPDGKKIVTDIGSYGGIFNADGSGQPVLFQPPHGRMSSSVRSVAFSPDGNKVVTSSGDNAVRIFDADGSGKPFTLKGYEGGVKTMAAVMATALSLDGKKIAGGCRDGTAWIADADGSGEPLQLSRHPGQVESIAFSPDGRRVVTGCSDRMARVFNADGSGAPVLLGEHQGAVRSVAFSRGDKVATASGKTVRIFNADGSGKPLILNRREGSVYSIKFSPDGEKLAAGSSDQTVRIYNVDGSGEPVFLNGHKDPVTSVTFSADGKMLATGSSDHTVRIWLLSSDVILSALWNATTDCLPVDRRQDLLLESHADARAGYDRCRKEVARRSGWLAP